MVKKSRREFIKNAGLGCLSLSVAPYLIGINNEASSETVGSFNKHSFLNLILSAGMILVLFKIQTNLAYGSKRHAVS